jgi:hypothetical protein
LVRLVISTGLPDVVPRVVHVVPLSVEERTTYDVIAVPFAAGAVHDNVAFVSPRVAVTFVGVPGTAAGVTVLAAAVAAPVPIALIAATRKWYACPFVSDETVADVAVLVSAEANGDDHATPSVEDSTS